MSKYEEKDCDNCKYTNKDVSDEPCCMCKNTALFGTVEHSSRRFLWECYEDDTVNHPAHYTDGKIEVIDFIEDKKLGLCLGNAIKYIARAGKKDPTKEVEDLKKAKWYIERRIKEIEEAI